MYFLSRRFLSASGAYPFLYAAPADTVTTNDNVASVSEPTRSEYPVGEEQNSDLTTMALTSRIENGVYAIQNLYSNMYIDIVQDSPNRAPFFSSIISTLLPPPIPEAAWDYISWNGSAETIMLSARW